MNKASYLFASGAMHSAASRRLRSEPAPSLWQRTLQAFERAMQFRREAAEMEALAQLDEHQLRDIGADDALLAMAAARRERREHPFAPNSLRGIEVASRRMNW